MEENTGFSNFNLDNLGEGIAAELESFSSIKSFKKGDVLIKKDSYLSFVPIVLQGLIKVYTTQTDTDKELLLYYIKENESCIMTFTTAVNNLPSKIEAIAESDVQLLLIPLEKMDYLISKYIGFNKLFYSQYNIRYLDLLDTINSLVFDGLDKRLFEYLKEKHMLSNGKPLTLKHKDIATDLGTAREVVTRLLKKLETDGKLQIKGKEIILS